ncbi:MAG: HpcH/HpaI aldolase [Frankiales bacterium]|nr:HpcH/HpaI aldolase [Frankiales bacterium]
MTHESLVKAWSNNGAAVGGWVSGGAEFTLDLYRRAGYDYVGIDCQHTPYNEAMAAAMLQRTPVGAPATIVRVSKNDSALIGKLADAGADGVIIPMVDTAAEAAAALEAVRYPPRGVRSFGPMRSDLRVDDLVALGDRVAIFVMIETADGLANVEEIAAVPGLTGVYVGPADLSIGLGLNPLTAFTTEQLYEPIERIRKACEANDLILGMHQASAASAGNWISRGVRLASLGGDSATFLAAAIAGLKEAKEGGSAAAAAAGPKTPYES